MTTGLPARVAICAVLLTAQLAGPVRAETPAPGPAAAAAAAATTPKPPRIPTPKEAVTPVRRPVAVIDLSEDDLVVRELVGKLYETLYASDTMSPPSPQGFSDRLVGTLYDEDAQPILDAGTTRASAQTELDEADSARAAEEARTGLALLAKVRPTPKVQALYADLSFLAGLAALDQGKAQEANLALALTHRLDPSRQLSDAAYPPNIIAAYKRAVESRPQLVKVDVMLDPSAATAEGRVWIDFVDRGPIGSFDGIEVGNHVITFVGPAIHTYGVSLQITGPTPVVLKPVAESPEDQVSRARVSLARAEAQHDDTARMSAMKALAALLGVSDVVLISKDGEALQWETWRDGPTGFSRAYTYNKDQTPEGILGGLGPLHRPKPPEFVPQTPLGKLPVTVDAPWYRETWIQASVGAGVIAAVVGGILLATRARPIDFTTDIKDVGASSSSR